MPSKELRFSEFLSSGTKSQTEQNTDDQADTGVGTSDSTLEALEESPASGTDATSSQADQGQESPKEATIRFEDVLRQKGFPVDDESNPAELYEHVVARAIEGSQAMSEAARLRAELESLRAAQALQSQQPATAAAPLQQETRASSEPETTAQQVARRFRELQKYDPLLENYVERDDSGYVKPIASFGQVSIDAARTINEYEKLSREQADMLLRNPLAVVEDSQDLIAKIAEEKAMKLIEARFSEMQSKAEAEQRAFSQQEQERQDKESLGRWHEENKSKLFHLDDTGNPRPDFFGSGDVAWTKTGQLFRSKLSALRSQLPGAPELTLRQLALEFASVGAPAQQAAVAAPAAQAQPVEQAMTQAQQRRLLADIRQPVPNQNTPAADVGQVAKTFPTLRLANMVRMNPENAERVSGWRN